MNQIRKERDKDVEKNKRDFANKLDKSHSLDYSFSNFLHKSNIGVSKS